MKGWMMDGWVNRKVDGYLRVSHETEYTSISIVCKYDEPVKVVAPFPVEST